MCSRYAVPHSLVGLFPLFTAHVALAYPPIECYTDAAKDDFKESPLIVIGKVTAIERYRTPDRLKPGVKLPFYVATVTVGRTLKGDVKPGEEILFLMGFGRLPEQDNLHSSLITVANSHSGWYLDVDNAYLLCLSPSKYLEDRAHAEVRRDGDWRNAGLENRDVWEPRSCHNSVHRISSHRDPARVGLYLEHGKSRSEESAPLEEFIADQTKARGANSQQGPPIPRESNSKER